MRRLARTTAPAATLDRILEGLERELIDVSDEEIFAAARDLRMKLDAKESAAYFGLRTPAKPRLSDFFGFDADASLQLPRKEPGKE